MSRHVDLNLYNVTIDEVEGTATFPLWNLSGQMVGYQQYRPSATKERRTNPKDSKYFTKVSPGQIGVFGVETLNMSPKYLFLVEGIFDAVRVHNLGFSCIATLSNNPVHLKNWLGCLNRQIFGILDSDDAGNKLAKYCNNYYKIEDGDLADSTSDTVVDVVSKLILTTK